jgi:hypothetical protein
MPTVSVMQSGCDLGDYRKSDCIGTLASDVESDWSKKPVGCFNNASERCDVRQHPLCTCTRTEHADIRDS